MLVGCSTTTAALKESGTTTVVDIPANYQMVYRRINQTIGCTDGMWAGGFASFQVDRELYTELGIGEISLRMNNAGVNNYYSTSTITRTGPNSSRLEVTTGNSLGSRADMQAIVEAAQGRTPPNC